MSTHPAAPGPHEHPASGSATHSTLRFLTAASAPYAASLANLLASARRLGLHRTHAWIVADLGLEPVQRAALSQRFPWVRWHDFDFSAWPPHVAALSHSYAWKPLLIRHWASDGGGPVLWLDAATLLRAPPQAALTELAASGIYVTRGQSPLGLCCDPLTLERLDIEPDIADQPVYVAGVIGWDARRPDTRALLDEWCALCLEPALICPRTPRLKRHTPEQALLTVVLRRAEARGERVPQTDQIDISSTQPIRWMSSRNKVPAHWPAWLTRWAPLYWRLWKWGDRLWLRLDGFDNRHLGGWRRLWREHFSVRVGRRGQAEGETLRAPWSEYWADPFVWRHRGRDWVLVEAFSYRTGVGRLQALALDGTLRPTGAPVAIDSGAGHASYPFVFEHDGAVWMVPETCARLSVDLYRFDDFPHGARRVRRLLHGINAADSNLLRHDGRWWLVTSVYDAAEAPNRYLAIFHTDDLLRGRWTPHPVNAEQRDGQRRFGHGRGAGPWVREGAHWLRPVQASEDYYGQRLAWRRVTRLDASHFDETPADAPPDMAHAPSGADMHHACLGEALWATDTRDRRP